jgi:TPR repeat protein/very-short-patch-repair endonuclease
MIEIKSKNLANKLPKFFSKKFFTLRTQLTVILDNQGDPQFLFQQLIETLKNPANYADENLFSDFIWLIGRFTLISSFKSSKETVDLINLLLDRLKKITDLQYIDITKLVYGLVKMTDANLLPKEQSLKLIITSIDILLKLDFFDFHALSISLWALAHLKQDWSELAETLRQKLIWALKEKLLDNPSIQSTIFSLWAVASMGFNHNAAQKNGLITPLIEQFNIQASSFSSFHVTLSLWALACMGCPKKSISFEKNFSHLLKQIKTDELSLESATQLLQAQAWFGLDLDRPLKTRLREILKDKPSPFSSVTHQLFEKALRQKIDSSIKIKSEYPIPNPTAGLPAFLYVDLLIGEKDVIEIIGKGHKQSHATDAFKKRLLEQLGYTVTWIQAKSKDKYIPSLSTIISKFKSSSPEVVTEEEDKKEKSDDHINKTKNREKKSKNKKSHKNRKKRAQVQLKTNHRKKSISCQVNNHVDNDFTSGSLINRLEILAQAGSKLAQFNLAQFYWHGFGLIKPDKAKAIKWYEAAAEQHLGKSEYNLGTIYYEGKLSRKDPKKAFEFFERAAKHGCPQAMQNCGYFYETGLGGVTKSPKKAKEMYEKAASFNIHQALFSLALGHRDGTLNMKQDLEAYREKLIYAAKAGSPDAYINLGMAYLKYGYFKEQAGGADKAKNLAYRFFKKGDELYKDPSAQYNLGLCYFHGIGTKKCKQIAINYFKRAADGGHLSARQNLINIGEISPSKNFYKRR